MEEPKSKKGISIGKEVMEKQKRLKAKGFSVKDGEVKFILPKEVKAKNQKNFDKKKKAKQKAKKNKRKNRL